ncbi:MAG: PD40 domain-containing protein, partial [Lewinella sp.]|nr:PD40 domain-containing protein [Lewinella sp.]
MHHFKWFLICLLAGLPLGLSSQGFNGYYQYPALHGETLVFAAEGDLWTVPLTGGLARRLTTHLGEESYPFISPDGQTLAFSATYEGPTEVYTMPLTGGLPERQTYEADPSLAQAWTPDGQLTYASRAFSTLPDWQLVQLAPVGHMLARIPLSQASEVSYDDTGQTIYFVRPSYHGNVTKRYTGGTARQIWTYTNGADEAVRLSTGHEGESHHPMWWNGRIYHITDRDGTMNIWSMNETGGDLQQHTHHVDFDVRYAYLNEGRIVYQRGADIWLLDLATGQYDIIPIRLMTDLEQLREKWVDEPATYITSVAMHPEGEQLVITARGRVFVVPAGDGRIVQLTRHEGVRYRDAVFSADGKDIITLSDESGEFEFVQAPATGIGTQQALTNNGTTLRYTGRPSPDGKWLAYDDLNSHLWLLNLETGAERLISTNNNGIGGFSWSPDSRWLAFEQLADNTFLQIILHQVEVHSNHPLTTDRANSMNAAWSPDGQWLYFLSDRHFQTLVGSPWGTRQPEPYWDRQMKIYQVSLQTGTRSPFRPDDELVGEDKEKEDGSEDDEDGITVRIDLDGLPQRIQEVPVPPGNYSQLRVNKDALYAIVSETGIDAKRHLKALKITNDDPEWTTLVEGIRAYELSADGKKLMIRQGSNFYVTKAGTGKISDLSDSKVDLSKWAFSMDVREDWRQIFTDAWRMERDYFYDPGMHGLDWDAMHAKYLPLVDRVTTRAELSDLIGRFVGELSALHTSVRGGDVREGDDDITVASLGARLTRDEAAGGYRIEYIYRADPDYPDEKSPLDHPELMVAEGDIITHINGQPTLPAPHINALLRNQAGQQVRIGLKSGSSGEERDLIVVPLGSEYDLRYHDWEYTRRLAVDEASEETIGYVHLRAMGSGDLAQWYREFYPVFNRQGLIIDARHNRGG